MAHHPSRKLSNELQGISNVGVLRDVEMNRPQAIEACWDGPEDPFDPYNWPSSRKVSVGIVCSISQLVTTMSASMLVPALEQILDDLGISASSGQIAFSVFFLGLGFAPFLIAPLSEMYGRKPVWLAGNVLYILWNSLCPVNHSTGLMIAGRLLSGAGASVGITLTGPVLADMYGAKDRGKAVAIAGILPYLGPAIGPIVGGVAAQHLQWPWLFWILSIFDAFSLFVGVFVIHESYAPVLLRRKAVAAVLAAGKEQKAVLTPKGSHSWRHKAQELALQMWPAVKMPMRLLCCRPIVSVLAVSLAVQFGVYTILLSTFAQLWTSRYGQSPTTASLHYIAIAIGAFVCAQAGGPLMDFMWRRIRAAHPDQPPAPEDRVPYMVVGATSSTIGMFWYAWAADQTVHWAVVDGGVAILTCGNFMFSQGMIAYLLDEFPSKYSASSNAASRLGTYVFGFAFPIFAPQLYARLGYGWGTSIMALVQTALSVVEILSLWLRGPYLRSLGRRETD